MFSYSKKLYSTTKSEWRGRAQAWGVGSYFNAVGVVHTVKFILGLHHRLVQVFLFQFGWNALTHPTWAPMLILPLGLE